MTEIVFLIPRRKMKKQKVCLIKSRRRKDFAMILGVFKAGAKGFTLSGNEQAPAGEFKSTQKPTPRTIAIIGLGYVGLPLALTFGRQYPTIGFDINPTRINELQQKLDSSGECTLQDFLQAPLAHFSNDPKHLAQATIYLIAVPTPITRDHFPNLSYLQSACELVGSVLKVGDIVVFEIHHLPHLHAHLLCAAARIH